ncbi:cytosolic Fe-S cluster assembly factor narfl [Ixodes scapularis]
MGSSLMSVFAAGKTALVAHPALRLSRERGGWSFPCIKLTASTVVLKTVLTILDDAYNQARQMAVYFLETFYRDLEPCNRFSLAPAWKRLPLSAELVLTSLRATAPLGAVTKGDASPYVPEPSTTVITGLHVPPGIAEEDLPVITDCDGSFDKSIVVLDLPIFFEQGTPRVFVDGYIGARHFDCVGFGAGTLGDMQLTLLLFTQVLTSLRATAPLGAVTKGDAFPYVPEPSTTVITGLHVPPGIAEEDLPVITDCDGSFDKSIVVLDLPIFFEQGTPRVFVDGYIGARHFDCVGFGAGTLGDMQLTLLLFTQVLTSLRATAPLGAVTKGDAFPYVPEPSTTVITGLHVPPGIAEEDLPVITDCDGSFDKSIVVLDLPIFFEQGTPRVFVDGYIGARHFDCVGFGAGTLGDMQLTLLLFTQSLDLCLLPSDWKVGCLNGGAQLRPQDGDSKSLLKRVEEAYHSLQVRAPSMNKEVLEAYRDWLQLEGPDDAIGGDRQPIRTGYHAVEKMTSALNIRWKGYKCELLALGHIWRHKLSCTKGSC